jgi:hypothetical protein
MERPTPVGVIRSARRGKPAAPLRPQTCSRSRDRVGSSCAPSEQFSRRFVVSRIEWSQPGIEPVTSCLQKPSADALQEARKRRESRKKSRQRARRMGRDERRLRRIKATSVARVDVRRDQQCPARSAGAGAVHDRSRRFTSPSRSRTVTPSPRASSSSGRAQHLRIAEPQPESDHAGRGQRV